MNIAVLIDAVVRQTSALVAQLAMAGGRPSLAHTSNQVFMDVVRELKQHGVGNKVIADMFGMPLRTYHDRVRRLEQKARYGGCSLWEAVLDYIHKQDTVPQAEILLRFRKEDALTLRGIIKDMVDGGYVTRSGRGSSVVLKYVSNAPQATEVGDQINDEERRVANLVWVVVNRLGECTPTQIFEQVPSHEATVHRALELLVREGKLQRVSGGPGERYLTAGCHIALRDPLGWEAAMFDHYQAVVSAMRGKLAAESTGTTAHGGGSTYTYIVSKDHPLRAEVEGFLQEVRWRAEMLRQRVAAFNQQHPEMIERPLRITTYVGQSAD
jgi:hypothetical protein